VPLIEAEGGAGMEREWCNACQAETPQDAVGLTEDYGKYVLLVCDRCGGLARRGKQSLLQGWENALWPPAAWSPRPSTPRGPDHANTEIDSLA
jgi:hypothetical protein